LPNPCTAAVARAALIPRLPRAARLTWTTPRDVASARPSEPPRLIGLLVTTPRTVCPRLTESVSMIQAIVSSSVPMSGAGMSWSGPMIGPISLA
jgi:hypothetical protein